MDPKTVANLEPLGTRIRRQRRRLGWTLDDLARRCRISKPYLSLIENGRVTNPPSDEKLRRLEESLGFDRGELLARAHLQRTPADVRAILQNLLVQAHRTIPPADITAPTQPEHALVAGLLRELASRPSEHARCNGVPLINTMSAGYPAAFMDLSYPRRVASEYLSCPDVADREAFAVRVVGDSMSPKYKEGDIVIFSPTLSPRSGDDCFIRFTDGTTTFKQVFLERSQTVTSIWRLQSRCEETRPQEIVSGSVLAVYRAVYRYQKVDGSE
jgi:transcriptional regulator with XRE-family HTH domain